MLRHSRGCALRHRRRSDQVVQAGDWDRHLRVRSSSAAADSSTARNLASSSRTCSARRSIRAARDTALSVRAASAKPFEIYQIPLSADRATGIGRMRGVSYVIADRLSPARPTGFPPPRARSCRATARTPDLGRRRGHSDRCHENGACPRRSPLKSGPTARWFFRNRGPNTPNQAALRAAMDAIPQPSCLSAEVPHAARQLDDASRSSTHRHLVRRLESCSKRGDSPAHRVFRRTWPQPCK